MILAYQLTANLAEMQQVPYIGPRVVGITSHQCICGEMNQTSQASAGLK